MSEAYVPRGFVSMRDHHAALEKIEDLKCELSDLKRGYKLTITPERIADCCGVFDLTPGCASLLIALTDGQMVRSPGANHVTKTTICYVRGALRRLGYDHTQVRNVWGQGYVMDEGLRQQLRGALPGIFGGKK